MTLLNAGALGALGLAVPLILLYLLKMKRQDRVVPSNLLWSRVIQDLQATHPFQKLRRNLLLFLQLLALALLTLALARPVMSTSRTDGRTVALVIDCSASMKARDVGGKRRFDSAISQARDLIDSLKEAGAAQMIVASGSRTILKVGLTTDRFALRRGLDELAPEDVRNDMNAALVLAASALRGKTKPEIYLFTDGAGVTFEGGSGLPPVRYIRVGNTGDNVAVTMLDVRSASGAQLAKMRDDGELADGRFPYQIFAGVRNFGIGPVKGFITLHYGDQVVGAREITLAPATESTFLFNERLQAGVASISVDIDDVMPEDNVAHFCLRPPREARIALLGTRSPFFERAFKSFPFVVVDRVVAGDLKTTGYDLVVSDGLVPDPLPDAPFVVFRPDRPMPDVEYGGTEKFPDITDWTREHPLMRSVDFADVHVAEALAPKVPPPGRILLKGPGGMALAVLSQRPGHPFRVSFGFALTDSDWPLRPSFPIFAWNLVQQSIEATTIAGASHFRTGALAMLPALGQAADLETPSGKKIKIASPAGDEPPMFTGTTEAGVYTVDWGPDRRLRFCCNLLDDRESDIKPAEELALGNEEIAKRENTAFHHRELWPWLAGVVLLIALFEWYAFHRKVGS